jgi:predicted metal-dependent peptidase
VSPRQRLAAGRVRTFEYAPYLASYIYGLKQQEAKGSGTCGISKDGVIYWDPAFVTELSVDMLAYVVLHEAFHLIFRHHARAQEVYGEQPTHLAMTAMNIAGDLVIEQTLEFMQALRPDGAIHLGSTCPQLGITLDFPPNLDMIAYFRLIMARLKAPGEQPGDGAASDDQCKSGDRTAPGRGRPEKRHQESDGKEGSAVRTSVPRAVCSAGSGGSASDGVRRDYETADDSWQAFGELVSAAAMEQAIDKQEAIHPGSVPGVLKEAIRHLLRPQPDPFEQLRSVVASSTAAPLGGRMPTYRRLSRKQPAGMCRLRGQLSTASSAVVVIDTSGSMNDRETKERALQVIADGLRKLHSVKVVCADTQIRSSARLRDVNNFVWEGGGGTDMASVLSEVDHRDRPDSIVLVTDAATRWPPSQTRARVVVALTCDSSYRQQIPSWCKTVPLFAQKLA